VARESASCAQENLLPSRRAIVVGSKPWFAPQKHVWRAEIVLLTADGVGMNEIMRGTGKSKTCVWRWQERFIEEGFAGLLRDKTRPSRIKPLDTEAAERVVALTLGEPPGETTHWTGALMAKTAGLSVSAPMACNRTGYASSSSRTTRASSPNCAMSSGFMSIRL
jgi:hypothetical protein